MAEIAPSKKLPEMFNPAVCHPVSFPKRFGSVAMKSLAIFPAWYRDKAPIIQTQ